MSVEQSSQAQEEWRAVVGYEGLYEVSNLGNVKRLPGFINNSYGSKKFLPGGQLTPNHAGPYPVVGLRRGDRHKKNFRLHELVLAAFHGPKPLGCEARHFPDSDRQNNRADNLCWGTKVENAADKLIQGGALIGARNHQAKLTGEQVAEIRRLAGTMPQHRIAKLFGVYQQHISRILSGKRRSMA